MAKIFILLFAMIMMAISCLAITNNNKKARLSKRDIPNPNTVVKLAQNGLRNMMVVAKLTADNELNLLQPKKPKSDASNTSEFGVSANPTAGGEQNKLTSTQNPVDA
jgi:uncharacterized lipoprotein YajG